MANTIAVLEGGFGSVGQYWMTTMKASQVINSIYMPKDIPEWKKEGNTVEDQYQRDCDFNRVKKQIAPYLVKNKDRFFSSLVVAIYKGTDPEFTPLTSLIDINEPKFIPLKQPTQRFGYLTIPENSILVPLDGQHRLAALKMAITGKDQEGQDIQSSFFEHNPDLADEDVSVILFRFQAKQAKSIFNSINRYAKPTSKAVNLITSDTDICAIIARTSIANMFVNTRIVNLKGNQLNDSQHFFTTLATLYDAVTYICSNCADYNNEKIPTDLLPEASVQNVFDNECIDVFKSLFKYVEVFKDSIKDPEESGDEYRVNLRKETGSLLMKPLGQLVLIRAYYKTKRNLTSSGETFNPKEICEKINAIDWRKSNPLWENVLMAPDGNKILSGQTVIRFATDFISYMIGAKFDNETRDKLLSDYQNLFPEDRRDGIKLPKKY